MKQPELTQLAQQFLSGQLSEDRFLRIVSSTQLALLADATLDLDRQRRCGFPEVVFGEGKSVEQLHQIAKRLLASGIEVLATRVSADQAESLLGYFPQARYNAVGRILRIPPSDQSETDRGAVGVEQVSARRATGQVAIVTAGTSDFPVAEEARETLEWMGVAVTMIHDVGVAGPHRLPAHLDKLDRTDAVVVIAGLEGALPSVVGGYVDCPVIAVPTSIGYGASFGGVAALLGMLNSCAANVTVVNIDAGFKAAYVAGLIARGRRKE